ncbi:MAG: hypothetical protein RMJ98_10560, partial [Myxococcales bacterium]|nr:hypothetical protein [Myxococcales bacterium]
GKKSGAECQGSKLFTDTFGCLNSQCAAACGGGDAKCGFTSQTPACQTCFEEACCAEFTACSNDTLCAECVTGKKSGAACQGNKAFVDAFGCLNSKCGAECGGGGSGGSGGSGAGGSLGSAGNNASGSGGSGQSGSTSSSGGTGTVGSSDGGSGTPGNGQGGSAAGGSESSPGGGTSGAGGAGTSAPAPGATTIDSKGDCTCQVPGSGAPIPGTPLAALAALGALLGCRRRGRIR